MRRLAERLRAAGLRQNFFGFRISDFGFPPTAAWVGPEGSTVLFRDPANAGRCFSARSRGITRMSKTLIAQQSDAR